MAKVSERVLSIISMLDVVADDGWTTTFSLEPPLVAQLTAGAVNTAPVQYEPGSYLTAGNKVSK